MMFKVNGINGFDQYLAEISLFKELRRPWDALFLDLNWDYQHQISDKHMRNLRLAAVTLCGLTSSTSDLIYYFLVLISILNTKTLTKMCTHSIRLSNKPGCTLLTWSTIDYQISCLLIAISRMKKLIHDKGKRQWWVFFVVVDNLSPEGKLNFLTAWERSRIGLECKPGSRPPKPPQSIILSFKEIDPLDAKIHFWQLKSLSKGLLIAFPRSGSIFLIAVMIMIKNGSLFGSPIGNLRTHQFPHHTENHPRKLSFQEDSNYAVVME